MILFPFLFSFLAVSEMYWGTVHQKLMSCGELQVLRCKTLSLAMHGWRDWCMSRKARRAVCLQAVSRMQHKNTCAAFLAWKGYMPVSRAQKLMLKRCIVRLQHSNLSSAFLIWQSSVPVMRALRSMTAASIARWRSGYAPLCLL